MSRRSSNATSRPAEHPGARSDRGISLIALVASVAIIMIGFMITVPTLRYVTQREREEELLFRGFEIVKAIRAWQKINNNMFPTSFESMVTQKVLRKEYDDPFAKKRRKKGAPVQWRLIAPGQPLPECMIQAAGTEATPVTVASRGGQDGEDVGPGRVPRFDPFRVARAGMLNGLFAGFGAPPVLAQGAAPDPPAFGGPFSGVISRNPSESYGVFMLKNTYDKWCFSVDTIPESTVSIDHLKIAFMTFPSERKPKFTGKGKKDPERRAPKKVDDAGDSFAPPDETPPEAQ